MIGGGDNMTTTELEEAEYIRGKGVPFDKIRRI